MNKTIKNSTSKGLLVFLCCLSLLSLKAEIITGDCFTLLASHESATAPGEEICIEVSVRNFTDIASFQYTMTWDSDVLQFEEITNEFDNSLFTGGAFLDKRSFSWLDQTTFGITLPDDTPLYNICFTVLGAMGTGSAVDFVKTPTLIEVIGSNGNNDLTEVSATLWGGSIQVDNPANNSLVLVDGCAMNTTCAANNGAIDVTIDGGQLPYSYSWIGENAFSAITEDVTGLGNGAYLLTVTDNAGEELHAAFQLASEALSISGTTTADACTGPPVGRIMLTINNGIVPYTFAWSNGETTQDIFNLEEGLYTVTVSDATACTSIKQFNISSGNIADEISATIVDADCSGNNGEITLAVPGNPADFTFLWSTGDNTISITNLSVGIYTVTVSDIIGGCIAEKNYSVNNQDLIVSASYECFGVGGPAEFFAAAWNNAELYTFEWSNGAVTTDSLISSINGLAPGAYSVTVTGQTSGCVATLGPIQIDCSNALPTDCFALIANSANASSGGQVCIPVTTQGFNDLLGVQNSLSWDAGVLSYSHTQNYGINSISTWSFGENQTANGILAFAWISNNLPDGDVLSDGSVLFEVCFDVVGANSSSSFINFSESPTPYEVVDSGLDVIGFNGVNGTLKYL